MHRAGEPQIQAARHAGAGEAERRAVARGGLGAGTRQQRLDDARPNRAVRRGRAVADIDGRALRE